MSNGRTIGWSKRIKELASSIVMNTYNTVLRKIFYKKTLIFYTTEDEQVCNICSSLHGVIFSYKNSKDILPIHPSCRCTWITVREAREAGS